MQSIIFRKDNHWKSDKLNKNTIISTHDIKRIEKSVKKQVTVMKNNIFWWLIIEIEISE